MSKKYTSSWAAAAALSVCIIFLSGCEGTGAEAGGSGGDVPSQSPTPEGNASRDGAVPSSFQNGWSYIDLDPSETNSPGSVGFTHLTFLADGRARYVSRELLFGGDSADVNGPAVYREPQGRIDISFADGVDPGGSLLGSTLTLLAAQVTGHTLNYGLEGGATRTLFGDRGALESTPPAGAWRFEGVFGMDFIAIAPTGYAVVQARDETGTPQLYDVLYTPRDDGGVDLEFFDGTPDNVTGVTALDGVVLEANGSLTMAFDGEVYNAPVM